MTNITKKHKNALADPTPSNSPPLASTKNPTIKELQEKNAELERRLKKYKQKQKTLSTQTSITPLIRPQGEAGSRKRGFILYDAMEMSKMENGPVLYDRMRDSVRKACVKVGLDLGAHYRHQDHEKLGQVFLLVRKSYPYLTPDRFPHNWAIADMVKGYIAGTRKERHRQARMEEHERKKETANIKSKKRTRDSDTETMPTSSSLTSCSTKSGRSKIRVEPDIENESEEDHPTNESKKRPAANGPGARGKDHRSSKPLPTVTGRSGSSSNLARSTKQRGASLGMLPKRTTARDRDHEDDVDGDHDFEEREVKRQRRIYKKNGNDTGEEDGGDDEEEIYEEDGGDDEEEVNEDDYGDDGEAV